MDLLGTRFCKFIQHFFETLRRNGRLAGVPPVIADLAFEVAAIKDLQLDIERLKGATMQYGLQEFLFMALDFFGMIHRIPMLSLVSTQVDREGLGNFITSKFISLLSSFRLFPPHAPKSRFKPLLVSIIWGSAFAAQRLAGLL